jgi:hypothetical protein
MKPVGGVEARHGWRPAGGSGVLRTNVVHTPNPDVALNKWSGAAAFWNNAATVTRDVAVVAPLGLPACVKVVTTGAAFAEGGRVTLNVVAGRTYRVSGYIRGSAGGESVRMAIGSGAVGTAQTGDVQQTTAFRRAFLTFTATGTGECTVAFITPAAAKLAQTFYVAAVLVEEATTYQPYFPTPTQLTTKQAAFTGTAYESSSTMEASALTLGLLTDDSEKRVWPRYALKTVSGLHSLGEAEDNRDPAVGRIGEITRASEGRGKLVTYEGWIQARSLLSLRQADAAMREAFSERDGEGRMDVTWHPLNEEFAAESAKFYEARVLGLDIVDVQENMRYERRFLLVLRMSDPRYFTDAQVAASATVAALNASSDFA